jgi:hypothetical protein
MYALITRFDIYKGQIRGNKKFDGLLSVVFYYMVYNGAGNAFFISYVDCIIHYRFVYFSHDMGKENFYFEVCHAFFCGFVYHF